MCLMITTVLTAEYLIRTDSFRPDAHFAPLGKAGRGRWIPGSRSPPSKGQARLTPLGPGAPFPRLTAAFSCFSRPVALSRGGERLARGRVTPIKSLGLALPWH